MSSKLLVANWKMNPQTAAEAIQLARAIDKKNVVIAAPFVYLANLKLKIKNSELCAQDVFWQEKGAYTGEISPMMLKKLGVEYVIIGHSERRVLGETDEIINKKIKAALSVGLKIILCVSEKKFIQNQIRKDLKGIKIINLIIAYEPTWAIGTGKADTQENSKKVLNFIKSLFKDKLKVLYGGSVNSKNAAGFLNMFDGLLVGNASLNAKEFGKIIKDAHFRN